MKKVWWWSWLFIVHLVTDIVVNAVNKTVNQGEFWPLLIAWGVEKKRVHPSGWNGLVMPENQGRSPVMVLKLIVNSGIKFQPLKDGFRMISEASTVVSVEKIVGSILIVTFGWSIRFPIPDWWNRFDTRVLPFSPSCLVMLCSGKSYLHVWKGTYEAAKRRWIKRLQRRTLKS